MNYYHVDVFSEKVLSGNGLTVVFIDSEVDNSLLLKIAQEFKQFETIFLYPKKDEVYPVKIFTVQEELPFAGHPLLGATAVLHRTQYPKNKEIGINLGLGNRIISLTSEANKDVYSVKMNQGRASLIKTINKKDSVKLSKYFNLTSDDLDMQCPVEVVSTGLPYILLPLRKNIEIARIVKEGLEDFIKQFQARFVYLFDTSTLVCRTWDNTGLYEDVATGSAAGPLIAYLVRNKLRNRDQKIDITQGLYLGRKSIISGWISNDEVYIKGKVAFFCNGIISI